MQQVSRNIRIPDFLNGKPETNKVINLVTAISMAFPNSVASDILPNRAVGEAAVKAWWYLFQEFNISLPVSGATLGTIADLSSMVGTSLFFGYLGNISAKWISNTLKDHRKPAFRDDVESWRKLDWKTEFRDLGFAISTTDILNAIEQSLTLQGAPYDKFTVDDCGLIVCEQQNLKKAVSLVYSTMQGKRPLKQFTIFHDGNFGMPGESAPTVLHVREDGAAVGVWTDKQGQPTFSIAYDAKGRPTQVTEVFGERYLKIENPTFRIPNLTEAAGRLGLAIGDRQKAIQEAWANIRLDQETHKATVTDDGAVIVRSLKTNKVDNPNGPAIILPDGRELFFREGKKADQQTPSCDADLDGLGLRPAF